MMPEHEIDRYNQQVLAAHRAAIDALCDILKQTQSEPDAEAEPHARRHPAAERTTLRFKAAVAILRTRLIKSPTDKPPPRQRVTASQQAQRLAARSPVLREHDADTIVTGDGDTASLGVDRGHRPSGGDDLTDNANAPADHGQRPVLVDHQRTE